jgi:hypothetical protein
MFVEQVIKKRFIRQDLDALLWISEKTSLDFCQQLLTVHFLVKRIIIDKSANVEDCNKIIKRDVIIITKLDDRIRNIIKY